MKVCPDQDANNGICEDINDPPIFPSDRYLFSFQIPYAPRNFSITFGNLQSFDGTSYGLMLCDTSGAPGNTIALCTQDPSAALGGSLSVDVLIPGDNSSLTLNFGPTPNNPTGPYFPQGGITLYIEEDVSIGSPAPPFPTITLAGNAGVTLLPAALSFGSQTPGTTSPLQTIMLFNGGLDPLSISSILSNGDFAVSDTCPRTSLLASQASCGIFVSFTPTAGGTRNGSITISDDAPGGTQVIPLSGTGDTSAVTLSPPSLQFGSSSDCCIGCQPLTVNISNTDAVEQVTIDTIAVSDNPTTSAKDFGWFYGSCEGTTLNPGESCALPVYSLAHIMGPTSGTLTVTDSNGDSHFVALTGAASPCGVDLNPSNASFGVPQHVGTTSSSPQASGFIGSEITWILPSPAFPLDPSSTCAVGSTDCTLEVNFSPTFFGNQTGFVMLGHDIGAGMAPLYLSGMGSGAVAVLSPSGLGFGPQPLGTLSSPLTVTLTNSGDAPYSFVGFGEAGDHSDFLVGSDCPSFVGFLESCHLQVIFSPTAGGPRKAILAVPDDTVGSPHKVVLTGLGVGVSLLPTDLVFPDQQVGTVSSALTVVLANLGAAPMHIWGAGTTGTNPADFSQSSNCPVPPATLASGANCAINVTFTPTAIGTRSAKLEVSHDAGASPSSIALTGGGVASSGSALLPASPSGRQRGPLRRQPTKKTRANPLSPGRASMKKLYR